MHSNAAIFFQHQLGKFCGLCLIVCLFCCSTANAQIITTVESRCLNTGQIIISGVVGSGGPYQLSLVSYPAAYVPGATHFKPALPDTFNSLFPGNYTLRVVDQGGAVFNFTDLAVVGTYIPLGNNSYQPVATPVTSCSSPNGTVTGEMTGGRAPYVYTIVSGPAQVGAFNTTGSFTGLVSGTYQLQASDSCSNLQTRTISVGSFNPLLFAITGAVINKVSCDSFSLDVISTAPAISGPGYTYTLTNSSPGPAPVVYSAMSLPIRFKATRSDILNGKVKVGIVDGCNVTRVYVPLGITNDWDFQAIVSANCTGVIIDSIVQSGSPFGPLLMQVQTSFYNNGGVPGVTNTQVISTLPYRIQGIPANFDSLTVKVTILNACGDSISHSYDKAFRLRDGTFKYQNCAETRLSLIAEGAFGLPVVYGVTPSNGVPPNNTGNFILPNGTYLFTATDSCGRSAFFGPIKINRGWKTRAQQLKSCTPGFLLNRIAVPSRSVGRLNVRQYQGAAPVNSSSVLLGQRNFSSTFNNCVLCDSQAVTTEWIVFDRAVPGATYTYVVEDSCGLSDTITVVNDSIPYRGFFHTTSVKTKCINKGDIIVSWDNDGPPSNSVRLEVYFNNSLFFTIGTGSNSNLAAYPNGQTLLSDYGLGVYIVKYKLRDCDNVYADTVRIEAYQQPVVRSAQNLPACANGEYSVIVSGSQGVAPYTYQIIGSSPGQYTTSAQTSPVFNLPGSQATVTVRLLDACLNSATRTIAVTQSAAPYIRSNPAVFAACSLPFGFSLFTDSLYAGSLFEWRKLTGTNAGTTVIGRRPVLALMYSSIQDTGTYQVRVYVPGSCYDKRSAYSVAPVAITCLPAVSGNILNDANGLNDNIVNGPGVTAGTLYVTLVDSTNKAVGVATVAADGTYFLLNVANGRYTAVLSTIAGVINAPAPAAQLPLPWVNTGEQIGTGAGSDGQVNGILTSIVVSGSAVNQLNFGMDQRPIANNVIAPVQSNPGGSNTVPVPPLNGADAEDGVYDGVSGINTIVIQTLPVNATLYYNGIAVVAGQIIQNYQPALLRIDPVDGTVVVTFTYSEVDAASVISIPALVTMVFRNFPLANADSAFTSQGAPVMMEVLANDDFGGDGPAANDIIITSAPMHGTASVINGGTTRNPVDDQILYTPANGYIGNDTLIYQICDSNGDCDTALVIIYIGLPVPVTLSNFTATPSGAEVLLGWQVQTAINVKEYVVLHSTDGIHYTAIGRQANRGTGQYQLHHPNPSNGMNYYQLKTVDEDGRITYSKIIALRFSADVLNAGVWPNPFWDKIELMVHLEQPGAIRLKLFNATGQLVRTAIYAGMKGKNQLTLQDVKSLAASVYLLQINAGNRPQQYRLLKR